MALPLLPSGTAAPLWRLPCPFPFADADDEKLHGRRSRPLSPERLVPRRSPRHRPWAALRGLAKGFRPALVRRKCPQESYDVFRAHIVSLIGIISTSNMSRTFKLWRDPTMQVHSRSGKRKATPYGKSQVAAPGLIQRWLTGARRIYFRSWVWLKSGSRGAELRRVAPLLWTRSFFITNWNYYIFYG